MPHHVETSAEVLPSERKLGGLDERTVLGWVRELAHVLPSQKPLEAFVHHNTLHSFEHMPFEQGVETAASLFGAEPYMAEAAFRDAWRSGRITEPDLADVLRSEVPDEAVALGGRSLPLRRVVRGWMLHLPPEEDSATLRWRLEETDELAEWPIGLPRFAFERLAGYGPPHRVQLALWKAACACPPPPPAADTRRRPRDQTLQRTGQDPDQLVNPFLVRWCAAFLDGGYAHVSLPGRSRGFYRTMLLHLSEAGALLRPWLRPLRGRARELLAAETSPGQCVVDTLTRLGVAAPLDAAREVLEQTLLALPGWPGMFVQLAERPDLAPAPPPPTELVDFLAIRLILDEAASRRLLRRAAGKQPRTSPRSRAPSAAWALFAAARSLGVLPHELEAQEPVVSALLQRFGEVRRRWLWHLAYERRYRTQILDSVLHHWRRIANDAHLKPDVQVVTCIDDREESLRRHLEELSADYETLGVAGFYGVAAYYRPLGEPHQRPLCPATVVPKHLLTEDPLDETRWARARRTRAGLGRLMRQLTFGSATLFRGGLISLAGWGSALPLVSRVLAPRLHGRLTGPRRAPSTRLRLAAEDPPAGDHGLQVGFTSEEMTEIVKRVLEDMGLTQGFAPLVVVLGHGSRSLNNPHEAAHDCGACGGGRGGPNARAFAEMANRADVRFALSAEGLEIPAETWFLGGYHNTCDDDIELYDLDRVPAGHRALVDRVRLDLDRARGLDAHERVRRFESAPLELTPAQALKHVETRAEDLAQPRPEYGHCTNALCFVGRRSWSRGLFLDRRVFLTSYDPDHDPEQAVLERLLASVGPVGAGINLEYYFSFVDPDRYGCNTKLPHNITALLGVMDGHSSDLRTGLPWQMVEIHEPMRLLNVIEAKPEQLLAVLDRQPGLKQLVINRWILVATFDPETSRMWFFADGGFEEYQPESPSLPSFTTSVDYYRGTRRHLAPASIERGRISPAGASL